MAAVQSMCSQRCQHGGPNWDRCMQYELHLRQNAISHPREKESSIPRARSENPTASSGALDHALDAWKLRKKGSDLERSLADHAPPG